MEELIINCETGEQTRRTFTPAEVDKRIAEIAANEAREKDELIKALKSELAQLHGDLVEIYAHQGDGFIAADVGPVEDRIAEIKAELAELTRKAAGPSFMSRIRSIFGR